MPATKKQRKELPSKELIVERINKFKQFLEALEPYGLYVSVLIAQGEKIIYHKGYGYQNFERKVPMKRTTALSIGSISKQFTATLLLQLRDQGLVAMHNTLEQFFPNVPDSHKQITLHQLLTHTSGLVSHIGHDFEYIPTEEFIEKVFAQELLFPPGDDFAYSNVGYSLAGIIIEKITNNSYQENLLKLLNNIGIKQVGWFGNPAWNDQNSVAYYLEGERTGSMAEWPGSWEKDKPYWNILANGGVCLSTGDFFRYLRTLFSGKLLSDESLQLMLAPEKENYGYGWDVLPTDVGTMISHDGGNAKGVNAIAQYYRDVDLTVLMFSNLIINSKGLVFSLEKIFQSFLLGKEIKRPTDIVSNDFQFKSGNYKVQGFSDENYLKIRLLPNKQVVVQFFGQKILNQVLAIEQEKQNAYEKMNQITDTFGKHIIRQEWQQAFALTEKKEPSQRRIAILTDLLKTYEKENGKITNTQVVGSISHSDFFGVSFLQLEGSKRQDSIPVVFQNPDEIFGFQTLFIPAPFSLLAKRTINNKIVCFSLETQKTVIITILDENSCRLER